MAAGGMRGWRRALTLALCACFTALSAAVHALHTEGAGHFAACSAESGHLARHDGHVEFADQSLPRCSGALRHAQDAAVVSSSKGSGAAGACPACLYIRSCVSSFSSWLAAPMIPPARAERPAVPETEAFRPHQHSPAAPRAPPISA